MEYPQLGNTHVNGNRFVGIFLGPVTPYAEAGTPVVNQMVQATVDAEVASRADIGGRYAVRFDGGKWWWVLDGETRVGRLSWSPSLFEPRVGHDYVYPRVDAGVLEVTRLLLDPDDRVINFGGIVRPV